MCFDRGILQAFLDHEVKNFQREEITKHLAECDVCQGILQQLAKNQQFTDELVMNYLTSLENPNPGEA